jgi:hypothetical protein
VSDATCAGKEQPNEPATMFRDERGRVDALIEGHIERTAAGEGEMPADVFFDVLLERIATRAGATLMLKIDVTDDLLVNHTEP